VAMDAHSVPIASFPLLPPLLFSPAVAPVFDPPGAALSLPGFEGSIPSFGDGVCGGPVSSKVRTILGSPFRRCVKQKRGTSGSLVT